MLGTIRTTWSQMEITKTECKRCRGIYPENLVLIDEICVYCRADEVEAIPEPQKLAAQKLEKEQLSAEAKAGQELAKRVLARKRLLPFVERFNPDYQAGWVHKDICQRLEKFSEQVANKESPRLMLFMPPRHGKSTLASIAFPAWHLGRHPEHEFISCSYSGSLAMSFSRKVRQLLREPVYKNVFEKSRLETGESLHPERYNVEALEQIRKAIGPRDWSALYQQNPVSDEGDYFNRDMIAYYNFDEIDTSKLKYYCAWDLAIGQRDRNDYSVGIVVGVDEYDNLFIVDVVRGRYDGFELVEQILDLYELWRPGIVGIERGHIEMALGPFLEKRTRERGLNEAYFKDLKVGRRDKELRARAIQGRMQQGMVYFPEDAAWTGTMVAELLRFPNGTHDDQVDALAWIGLMMTEFATFYERPEHIPSWRDGLKHLVKDGKRKSSMSA